MSSVKNSSPLPDGNRASGVLLHVTSLPGPYGIGDAGPAAMAWIDLLAESDQSYWQFLPLGPTGAGDSPYQSPSTFALNEWLISPDLLIEDGWLDEKDVAHADFSHLRVDFGRVGPFKYGLLDRAWTNFQLRATLDQREEFERFRLEEAEWLDDYTLFVALKQRFQPWTFFWDWPREIVQRDPATIRELRRDLAEVLASYAFRQFVIFRQWRRVHEYASSLGVRLIGDVPIFVSPDSADVWANPSVFLLDENRRPSVVAGVPPDYFSPTGQLWGSPLYDWEALKRDGYRWWIDRMRGTLQHVDLIRLDHFRGFEAAWHVPAGAPNAIGGQWVAGPGTDLFEHLENALQTLPVIAEDLGHITDEVRSLRDQFRLPGMRVLQFAFDGDPNNQFLPHRYVENCVVYTGTHDNDTTRGWYDHQPEHVRLDIWNYLKNCTGGDLEITWHLIREAMESPAALAMFPLQDLLDLGTEARMNVPGVADGNWGWRFNYDMPVAAALARLGDRTRRAERARLVRK